MAAAAAVATAVVVEEVEAANKVPDGVGST
jgi:hypothetical protein